MGIGLDRETLDEWITELRNFLKDQPPPISEWAKQMVELNLGGPPFAVDDIVRHPSGREVQITSGQYWGKYGLSNYWEWREVLPDGTLSEQVEKGYGWQLSQNPNAARPGAAQSPQAPDFQPPPPADQPP